MVKKYKIDILRLGVFCLAFFLLATPAMAATTELTITKYAIDGNTILDQTTKNYTWLEANLPVQGDGYTHYFHQGPTFNESDPFDPGEWQNVLSRDFGAVKGTDVKDLAGLVGGAKPGDNIKIKAADGLTLTYPYEYVYTPDPRQGPMVITWYNGEESLGGYENQGTGYPPSYFKGMRLIMFADTSTNSWGYHVFGDNDMFQVWAPQYCYNFSNIWPSSSGISEYAVRYINIMSQDPVPVVPTAAFSGTPLSGNLPLTVVFTDASTGSITGYAWDFTNDGITDSTAQSPSYQYTVAGTYTVKLTVTGPGGSDDETKVGYITVTSMPMVDTLFDDTVTLTPDTKFTLVPYNNLSASYQVNRTTPLGALDSVNKSLGISVDVTDKSFSLKNILMVDNIGAYLYSKSGSITKTWICQVNDVTLDDFGAPAADGLNLKSLANGDQVNFYYGMKPVTPGNATAVVKMLVNIPAPAAPAAAFGGTPLSGNSPLTVVFTDASTGSITGYAWDFTNDGITDSTAQSPSYQYTAAGTYTVTLTVTGPGGSDDETKTNYVTVSSPPAAPVAVFSGIPLSGNAPLTVAFTDASTGSITGYTWDFNNDGITDSTAQSPSYQYTAAGTYTVKLTVTGPGGSNDEVKVGYITVTSVPVVDTLFDDTVTLTPDTKFTLVPYNNLGASYQVNSTTPLGTLDSVNKSLGIRVDVTDKSYSAKNILMVDNIGNYLYSKSGSITYTWICQVNGVTLDDFGANATDGLNIKSLANGDQVNFYYGMKPVTPGNATAVVKMLVNIPAPAAPVAAFSGTPLSGNAPLTVHFTDASTGDGITGWSWDFNNDGTIDSTDQNPSIIYSGAGTYTVNLTVTNAGSSDSEVKTDYITVSPPTPALIWGPYLAGTTTTGTIINAKNDEPTIMTVEYATDAYYTAHSAYDQSATDSVSTQLHHVSLAGLTPDNLYHYRVVYAGQPTGDFHFSTFPESGPFTFVVYSDTQDQLPTYSQLERHKLVADRIAEESDIAFVLNSGDLVNDAANLSDWDRYFAAGSMMMANTTVYPALGNHDANNANYYQNYGVTEYYSFECGDAHVAVLDSNDWAWPALPTQSTWLANDLQTDKPFKFVSFHHPLYTSEANHFGGWTNLKEAWEGDINDNGVLAVFNGHVHAYERLFVNDTSYFVSGIGGGPSYNLANPRYTASQNSLEYMIGYIRVTVDPAAGTATAQVIRVADVSTDLKSLTYVYPAGTVFETVVMSLSETPVAPIAAFTSDVQTGTAPLTVQFTDASTGSITSWAWDFNNDGITDNTTQSPSYTYTAAGIYTVNLTVTNAAGNDSEVKIGYISVTSAPVVDTVFDGTVTLTPDTKFTLVPYNNLSASYQVNSTTPLGALDSVNKSLGIRVDVTDKSYSGKGILMVDNIGNYLYSKSGGLSWIYQVNGVTLDDFGAPTTDGLNLKSLANGDQVNFYYGMKPVTPDNATAVVKIKVNIGGTQPSEPDWTLSLNGAKAASVTKALFEQGLACPTSGHQVNWTDTDGNIWGGVPLWLLVGMIDDNPDVGPDHYNFNDSIAAQGYSVKVTSGDGWDTTLASQAIARNNSYIVANTLNGQPLPTNLTSGKLSWPLHLKGAAVFGGQQVGNITKIELAGLPQPPTEWTLTLEGDITDTITQSYFISAIACHHNVTWKDSNNNVWEGVSLWDLAGAVDDIETSSHFTFNDTRAAAGYNIIVSAADGFNATFSSSSIAHNDGYFVAYKQNNVPLTGNDAPLKLVGFSTTSGSQRVGHIVKITLEGLPDQYSSGDWQLYLNGKIIDVIPQGEFEYWVSHHSATYTDATGNIYTGIPLWRLMGWVDDRIPHGSNGFNDAAATAGYKVIVKAGDGYAKEFTSQTIGKNDNFIVANTMNGVPLPTDGSKPPYPLRLVGSGATGGSSIGNVTEIQLTDFQTPVEAPTLHIVKYGSDGTTIINETAIDYYFMENNLEVIGDGTTHYKYQGLTLDPTDLWDPTETKGMNPPKIDNAIKGTKVKDLVELVGGMGTGTDITFVASDGYETQLGYSNIYTNPYVQSHQGDAVLAWYADGQYVPQYTAGMRLFFTPADHVFGQWNMHEALDSKFWHYNWQGGVQYPSAAGTSNQNVIEIKVYSSPETDWQLELDGSNIGGVKTNISKTYLEQALACQFGSQHKATYTDTKGNVWEGMPLWFFAGFVDDADQHSDKAFNESLASAGYRLVITAGDGYNATIESPLIIRNTNYIIANSLNESHIAETDSNWPLRLTGTNVTGSSAVKNITSIRLLKSLQAPTAAFTVDPIYGIAPLTVKFTDASTGAPISWTWDFENDGTVDSIEQSPSHVYDTAGTYTVNLTVTNSAGSDSEIKTGYITVQDDADNDGILDTEEQGPGGADPAYDGNGDGTPDGQQEDVASFHTKTGDYVTLVSLGGINLSDVQAIENPSPADIPEYLEMPFGFIDFAITGITPGEAVTVQLHIPTGTTVNTYYKYGMTPDNANPHWYEFLFDGTTGAEIGENIITLHFVDGNRGDNDINTNGNITDPSGPGIDSRIPLTAAFSADPVSGTAPLSVVFTDASTGTGPLTYEWDFNNDGVIDSTFRNPSYVFTTAGTFTVKLTVNGPGGNDDEIKTDLITVNPAPVVPVAAFSSDVQTGTAPLTVKFTDQCTGTGPYTYAWDFTNDGIIESTEQSPIHVYTAAGTYSVNLTVTNGAGSDFEMKSGYITVTPAAVAPVAVFISDVQTGPVPLTVKFTDQSTHTPTSWKWEYRKGSGSWTQFSTAQSPSYTFSATGSYSIRLTATNAAGSNTQTKTSYIIVTALAKPDAAFIGTPTSGSVPLTVVFTDQSTHTPTSWKWEYRKGSGSWTQFSTAQSPSYTFSATGSYSIRLRATNAAGSNTQTKTSYITVTALVKPVADFSAKPLSGTVPLTVRFTDQSTGAAPLTYAWDFNNDGKIDSTVKNPQYTYTKPGTYIASLTVTNSAGSATKQVTITVQSPAVKKPVAQFTQDKNVGKASLKVQFTDVSKNNPASYLWQFGDGGKSTDENPSHTFTKVGVYTVRLTATNSAGSDSTTRVVVVLPKWWWF